MFFVFYVSAESVIIHIVNDENVSNVVGVLAVYVFGLREHLETTIHEGQAI